MKQLVDLGFASQITLSHDYGGARPALPEAAEARPAYNPDGYCFIIRRDAAKAARVGRERRRHPRDDRERSETPARGRVRPLRGQAMARAVGVEVRVTDLFERRRREALGREAPLAARMRPRDFDEFAGQEHILGPGRVLRRSIEADHVPSMILWGPPGSGKTTLAHLIAGITASHFDPVSAVTAGVADLRKLIDAARERRGMHGRQTLLFVDEIHRFNKAQQDVILPHVEEGAVTLIGATTENPSFEVVAPLLSRCRVFTLNALSDEDVAAIVARALADDERGIGDMRARLAEDAMRHLVVMANGDARTALNALELAVWATAADEGGERLVTLATVEDALQHRSILYDKAGDQHYDTISAFIKSVRGSDPDAAVYWLSRMIEAGEDPLFIARRLVILAAEDVGMADPQGLPVAVAAQQAGPLHRHAGGARFRWRRRPSTWQRLPRATRRTRR